MNNFNGKSVILFDGVCNLCNSSVNFIIKQDKKEHFLFASLQSDAAKEILLQLNSKIIELDSIILIEDEKVYEKSTAVLKITKHLDKLYYLLYYFIVLPVFIRNWIYNFIAKNRYKWFGKRESCMIPSLEIKNRFLS